MKKYLIPAFVSLGMFVTAPASAGEKEVRNALKQLDPHAPIQSIKPAKISGLYEVLIGADIYYVTSDGKYIISGDVYEARTRTNLTALARGKVYLKRVNATGESGMIIYEPKQVKRTLTVFTDVDCPYCRKFHKDLPQHLENGIRVRYIMMPLQGLQASTYKKSVNVWCSDDRNKALDTAKSGGTLKDRDCMNPVAANLALARSLGISSTPTLMTQDGVILPGYLPPAELAARLGLAHDKQAAK